MFIPLKIPFAGTDTLGRHRKVADYAQTRRTPHRNRRLMRVLSREQYLIDLTIWLNKIAAMNSPDQNLLDRVFHALADPTRRAILVRLARGPATVGELAEPFAMSLPAISRHLKVLVEAAMIHNQRDGKRRRCQLRCEVLGGARAWLDAQL
jgi:DNA-binding transcriptional ArsR family regulator